MHKYILNADLLTKVLKIAFDMGESWGIIHSGWFIPIKEDRELRIFACLKACIREIRNNE